MERRTKIVATIGPASRDPEVLPRMIEAGMDVARLNFSHGSAEEHAETARLVRDAANRAGRSVAILQDLPGPKLRIGALREDTAELRVGDLVTFECGNGSPPGDARRMSIAWDGLANAIEAGDLAYQPELAYSCATAPDSADQDCFPTCATGFAVWSHPSGGKGTKIAAI